MGTHVLDLIRRDQRLEREHDNVNDRHVTSFVDSSIKGAGFENCGLSFSIIGKGRNMASCSEAPGIQLKELNNHMSASPLRTTETTSHSSQVGLRSIANYLPREEMIFYVQRYTTGCLLK